MTKRVQLIYGNLNEHEAQEIIDRKDVNVLHYSTNPSSTGGYTIHNLIVAEDEVRVE